MQIDALNAIGMRWQSIGELSWERYYEAAKKYYEENGNLLAPYSYVNENGINIGQWLVTQRMAKKMVSENGALVRKDPQGLMR